MSELKLRPPQEKRAGLLPPIWRVLLFEYRVPARAPCELRQIE